MTSKYHNQSSRRHPLKRVRPDNENQGPILPSNGRASKKFCREPSEDSAFVEIEKSSDERAFDLFHKEYFPQLRPYFKHRSIAVQFTEYLWTNMIESSKVAFVKKILREQGLADISSTNFNDENDSESIKSLNESNRLNSSNKYSRGFLNDFLCFLKHSVTPRFLDQNSSSKMLAPLRRSSRIRRAPIKCVCSTCITSGAVEEHLLSTDNLDHQLFRDLINHYQQLDEQVIERFNSSEQEKLNETEKQVQSSPVSIPVVEKNEAEPSVDCLINHSNEKILSDTFATNECPIRRTFVILTELDEPFFGPYSIEFTITI